MPTCRDIITHALRQGRVTSSPTAKEMAWGLTELQSLYDQWFSAGMFGRLRDRIESGDYEAQVGDRVRLTDGATATLPESLEDDDEAPPYEAGAIEFINVDDGTTERHVFDNGAWVEIGALALDDEAPLASRGQAGLAACLSLTLSEAFGSQPGPFTVRQAGAFKTSLSLKLGSDAARSEMVWF
jgi:hypothetical protein